MRKCGNCIISAFRNNYNLVIHKSVKKQERREELVAKYETYARIRDERGYSDYRVSKETGIGAATISDWKNGISKPKIDKLFAIAKLFNVPVEDLCEEV